MNNKILLVCLVFGFLSCSNKDETKQLKQIDFIKTVTKGYIQRIELKEGEYLTFKFLNEYYYTNTDTTDYTRALFITIPVADTAFVFRNDSTHLFRHFVANCRGLCPDINIEEIKEAKITGKLIGKDKWQIKAKTKYFNFDRIIHLTFKILEKESIKL